MKSQTLKSRTIGVSINCPANKVYDFASNPENLPNWASGLSSGSIKKIKGEWVAESSMGRIRIKFAEKNKFGVLDHDVILENGQKFYNPMRIFPNNKGSELVFTLYKLPNMSGKAFEKDARTVKKDMERLKALLER